MTDPKREAVARIIDPVAFELSMSVSAQLDRDVRMKTALTKADAILALGSSDGEALPVAWIYDGPDSEHWLCERRDVSYNWRIKNGWTETPLYRQALSTPKPAEPAEELFDRAELAWQRFFYPAADCFDGPDGDKHRSVDLELADCLRLVLAHCGRLVVTPAKDVPNVQPTPAVEALREGEADV